MLFDRSWLRLGLGATLLILALGPVWGFGRQPADNSATNLQWLAWVTAGEGLHNNHHAAPTTARMAFRRREIDPAWPVIRLLRRAGWATVRHDAPPTPAEHPPAKAA